MGSPWSCITFARSSPSLRNCTSAGPRRSCACRNRRSACTCANSNGTSASNSDAAIRPIPLHVPAGAADLLTRLADLFLIPTLPALNDVFRRAYDLREYRPGEPIDAGDSTITPHALRHSAPNCGVRVDAGGRSLAYTGDTGVTPALVDLAAGVDLLLAEASLPTTDDGPHGHLCAADAARAATEAGAASLVLTHFPTADPTWLDARRDEARAIFPGDVHLARPGRAFTLGEAGGY